MKVRRGNYLKAGTLNVLAGSSFLWLASATNVQAQAPAEGERAGDIGLEEIVVTARRRAESLQDVPQTVDAVTGEEIERLNFQQFTDIAAVVPGLTLTQTGSGFNATATVRGAAFQTESSADPTVEFYLNDGPIKSPFLFQSLYDVGQIEVLRGPQGTLRGRASPSGSITVTSKQPDLAEMGGYVNTLGTDEDSLSGNGAFNIPIITDTLAARIAASYDESDLNKVRGVDGTDSSGRTKSARGTIRWEPNDAFTANVVYQYLQRDIRVFDGYESFSIANPAAPVVLPILRAEDRRTILDGATTSDLNLDIVNVGADYRFSGQKVSFVGSYSKAGLFTQAPQDTGNLAPGFEFRNDTTTNTLQRSQELRIASEERIFGSFDYTFGFFRQDFSSPSNLVQRTLIATQTGQFTLTPITTVNTLVGRGNDQEEKSVFLNLTYHLSDDTEFSAGARYIDSETKSQLIVNGNLLSNINNDEKPTVYNLAASHRFTPDFLVYANVGTSFRAGPTAVGIFRPPTPRLTQFTSLDSEDSTSYEVGFKADLLDRRLRINASVFHQDFKDYIFRGPSVSYVNLTQAGAVPALFNFLSNVDATIDGAEADIAYQFNQNLTMSLTLSYTDGEIDNGVIACNDFDGDGRPDRNPIAPTVAQIMAAAGGEAVAACQVSDRLSFAPDFSGSFQAEYTVPFTPKLDFFARGLYSFFGSNEQDPNNSFDNVDSYGLLNLYAGVRSGDGAWEVSLFGRNVTETEEVLNRGNSAAATPFTSPTGVGSTLAGPFTTASFTPVREFGLNVRYAFGSR